ncbi:MAG: argininosuccinate synthase [Planctomycetes bacterium]|nr:argininosuccinate synthase [Planctomycetota bacterium]NOG56061.1 argininosuccinate synthase [Planctomycetota bacterium]
MTTDNQQPQTVVLAFSGGLDTSFCVPYLIEKGYRVVTVFGDSGGVTDEQREAIKQRALELGAAEHRTVDLSDDLWADFVIPFIRAGHPYQDQYPLLCSDRYLIVKRSLELCRELGTHLFSHGCTGMGNDQVRFDLTARMLGDFEILAPIRDIQSQHTHVRAYEIDYLKQRGFEVAGKPSRYTVNENILGVTISGAEIDRFEAPGEATWQLCAPPADRPAEPMQCCIGFEQGVPITLDGGTISGPDMLRELNTRFGAYGVGRGIYTGDTVIGLKGRIVFECPALTALLTAHRALEEPILTRHQNQFKPLAARMWAELVYQGFFYEPLKADLQQFVESTQRFVTGEVTVQAHNGVCQATGVRSDHLLRHEHAEYAQSADWGRQEAEGFIRLLGHSSVISSRVNPTELQLQASPASPALLHGG